MSDDRIPNPYMPGEPKPAAREVDADWIMRLWAGGEHRRALELSRSIPLLDDELAAIRDACPGWAELAGLYPAPTPVAEPVPQPQADPQPEPAPEPTVDPGSVH